MGHMGWRRSFGLEAELEMADDPVDGCGIFDEGEEQRHLEIDAGRGL